MNATAGIDVFRGLLERTGCKPIGHAFRCPCHDDAKASASFAQGQKRPVVAHCNAATCGADLPTMLDALGATVEERDAILGGDHGRLNTSGHSADVTRYVYEDELARPLFSVVRTDGPDRKSFRQDRVTATGWEPGINGTRRVLYRLPEIRAAIDRDEAIFIAEGEKCADRVAAIGLATTCNPGGAGKWQPQYTEQLKGARCVVILADHDAAGENHAEAVARALYESGIRDLQIVRFLDLPDKADVADFLDALPEAERSNALRARCATAHTWAPCANGTGAAIGPWSAARSAPDFLSAPEPLGDFLVPRLVARGSLTLLQSPRGLGKTHAAHAVCANLARAGNRVLLIDRDNSRREIKRRLSGWGAAELPGFMVLDRDHAPPLTDRKAWEAFPVADYDLVVIDSIDSSTEGVGEQDSARPSTALASLLDVVHTAGGPAFLVLGNTIKSGAHGRGSGVIEDRADIVYEVRDATDLHPSGKKDWWLELPDAGRGSWADRASRRKHRNAYRLAFIASKFRIGEEPDPFVLELRLTEPWSCREATDAIVEEGAAALEQGAREKSELLENAATALREEIQKRSAEGLVMEASEGERFLADHGLSRAVGRTLITDRDGLLWSRLGRGRRGDPVILASPGASLQMGVARMCVDGSPRPDRLAQTPILAACTDQEPREPIELPNAIDAPPRASAILAGSFVAPEAIDAPS